MLPFTEKYPNIAAKVKGVLSYFAKDPHPGNWMYEHVEYLGYIFEVFIYLLPENSVPTNDIDDQLVNVSAEPNVVQINVSDYSKSTFKKPVSPAVIEKIIAAIVFEIRYKILFNAHKYGLIASYDNISDPIFWKILTSNKGLVKIMEIHRATMSDMKSEV